MESRMADGSIANMRFAENESCGCMEAFANPCIGLCSVLPTMADAVQVESFIYHICL